MEKDIDLLKELRKELGLYADKNKIKQGIALEHLIKAYKEIEEYYEEQNEVNAKLIPVSLVEEKIEELIKEGRHYNANKIEVLQELLEKR